MDDVQLHIKIVRRDPVNTFVTLHSYYCTEAPSVHDEIELSHERFLVVRRLWHPLQLSTTVTILVESIQ
jgi:hypothetical protein